MILTRCIEVMSHCLKGNICNLEFPGKPRNEIEGKALNDCVPPYVQYACQYWVHHLEQVGKSVYDQGIVHVFLQQHFLHWLEALALIGKISESIALIDTLHSIVKVCYSLHCFSVLIGILE